MIHLKQYPVINAIRAGLLLLFCSVALAQESSSSEKLKEAFLAILKEQVTQFVEKSPGRDPQMSPAETSQVVESLMKEAQSAYEPLLTLPESEANRLLTTGPDDKTNAEAMQRDIELCKKVERPMPALYKQMQDEVTSGEIRDGLELELTRRISEFHLRQLGLL